ncbi:MAG: PAS domain-containing sensor histidine kinase [Kofleriaceae bacterium]|nr:PAS domain-containing sensor histidine kinase [Kofleriaceae bacterium]
MTSTSRLRRVIEQMPNLVWTSRPDGTVDFCSQQLLDALGLNLEEMASGKWEETVHPDDRASVVEAWSSAIRDGAPYEQEVRQCCLGSENYRWYLIRAVPLETPEGDREGWVGSFTDITAKREQDALRESARHEAEARARELEQLAEMLRANERTRQLLLAILGHDLRNPLTAVLSGAELLMRDRGLGADARETAEQIEASAWRMKRLVELMFSLAMSNDGAGPKLTRRELDLGALLLRLTREIEQAHPGTTCVIRQSGRTSGYWDRDRLEQVFSNLLGNAVSHGAELRPIIVTLSEEDGGVAVRVTNEGTPIPADLRESIFDPYRRLSEGRASSGMGLGLSIARHIVLLHGGTISVSSTETTNTFTVVLPFAESGTATSRA